jgi:hypothetical protein
MRWVRGLQDHCRQHSPRQGDHTRFLSPADRLVDRIERRDALEIFTGVPYRRTFSRIPNEDRVPSWDVVRLPLSGLYVPRPPMRVRGRTRSLV